jgi:prepilin-type N-terminal cleavage/methylation domain-containing protein
MKTHLNCQSAQGFTLIETIVGMLIFLIASTALVPIFMTYRLATINNDTKLGGMAVSQQIMDSLRQLDITSLPNTGTESALPSGDSINNLPFKGKYYTATITYCENSSYCDTNTRHLKVKTYTYGNTSQPPVFELETIYTRIQ